MTGRRKPKPPHVFTEDDDAFIKAFYMSIGPYIGPHDLGCTVEEVNERAISLGLFRYGEHVAHLFLGLSTHLSKTIREKWNAEAERSFGQYMIDEASNLANLEDVL